MSQLTRKFITNDAVDGAKIHLDNNQAIRARNAANSADVNILLLDASNVVQVVGALHASGAVTGSNLSGSSSGTNTGDLTLTAVGAAPNADAASLSGQALTLQPFDSSFPGVAPASGGGTTNFLRADGTWAAPSAGSGANTALSNLASVAINTSLLPASTGTIDLGDATHMFAGGFIQQIKDYTGTFVLDAVNRQLIDSDGNPALDFNAFTGGPNSDGEMLIFKDMEFQPGAAADRYLRAADGSTPCGIIIEGGTMTGVAGRDIIVRSGPSDTGNTGNVSLNTGTPTAADINSGGIISSTGDVTGAGGSGLYQLVTGNAVDGLSGDFLIRIGTISGTGSRGKIKFQDGSEGTAGDIWTSVGPTGEGAWASPAAAPINNKELVTLSGTDITNQYIDLAHVAKTNSIDFLVKGGGIQIEDSSGGSQDYSVDYTGGSGGFTRINFTNDLATGGASALVAGDVVVSKYQY